MTKDLVSIRLELDFLLPAFRIYNPKRFRFPSGERAIQLIVEEGRKIAVGCPADQRAELIGLCNEVDALNKQLGDLCRRGQGNTPQAKAIARNLSSKLHKLKNTIQKALVNRVCWQWSNKIASAAG